MAQQGRRPWKGCMDILFFLFSTSSFFYVARSEKVEVEVDTAALAGGADNVVVEDQREQSVDYLIVGAGSGGLQLALFFEKYGRTYKILEKESVVASLWTKFPRFEELISVNKWVSNETQKERYDWHSFLESSLKMQDVTESYFPKGKEWHKYMALVAKDEGILEKVEFETQVERIALDDSPCVFLTNGEKRCANKRVFLGTGLKEKEEPFLEAMGGIPYSRVTKDMARHKRVCILGNGNSGFELAQNIFGLTEKTVIYGRNPPRFSAVTRYTGDVRLKYVQVLENFHGKLLDTVYWMEYTNFFGMPKYSFKYKNMKGIPKLNSTQLREASYLTSVAHWLAEWRCSAFFIATGVKSVAPEGITFGKRFANTNDWYQSKDNPTFHFLGWHMHERDFQKGAGGFLSGYRYLIRNLVHHLNEVDFGIPYPYMVLSSEKDVAFKVQTRLEAAADLIILQDGVIIRDAIVPVLDGDPGTYHYYEGISYDFHKDIVNRTDIIWVYFAWGDVRRSNHVFDGVYMYDDGGLLNIMLHPEVQVGNLTREILEDLEMAWRQPGWLHPTAKTVLQALRGDFDSWHPKEAYRYEVPYGRNSTKDDPYAKPRFQEGKGKGFEKNKFQQAIAVAVKDPTPTNLERLRSRMENSFPDLFDCHSQDADADTTKTE